MFNWIQNQLEDGRERGMRWGLREKSKMAGHVRRPTLSKGEPKQTLRCSNAEALFQVPAGPFRSLYPHSTHDSLRAAWLYHMWNFFMLHLVSPGDLCRWDAGGRWIALNARHWITGPTTWGKCLGRGNGSVERLARTGATLELVPAVEQEKTGRVFMPQFSTHLYFNIISYITLTAVWTSHFCLLTFSELILYIFPISLHLFWCLISVYNI